MLNFCLGNNKSFANPPMKTNELKRRYFRSNPQQLLDKKLAKSWRGALASPNDEEISNDGKY